jgi:UDP-2,3-diacylglucosamine pyrophosphatase LpxH
MFNEIPLYESISFVSKDGRRFLIIHGDQYDKFINNHKLLGIIGSFIYDATTYLNKVLFYIQDKLGRPHWSLSQYLKQKAKAFTHVIDVFEHSMSESIKAEGYNGVICGHIHMPKILEQDQFTYMNCGDWTENCTAIVEHDDGTFHILYYKEQQ